MVPTNPEYILNSIQWLQDHNIPVPADIIDELKKSGIKIDDYQINSKTLESIRLEIEEIKKKVSISEGNTSEFVGRLDEIVKSIKSMPAPILKLNDQIRPIINLTTPKPTREVQRIIRDSQGNISSTETTFFYD